MRFVWVLCRVARTGLPAPGPARILSESSGSTSTTPIDRRTLRSPFVSHPMRVVSEGVWVVGATSPGIEMVVSVPCDVDVETSGSVSSSFDKCGVWSSVPLATSSPGPRVEPATMLALEDDREGSVFAEPRHGECH